MALRPPKAFDHQKDLITIIRDSRVRDTYLPDEIHDVDNDKAKFSKSQVAQYVFELVKTYLPNVSSNRDVISLNDAIAEDVKNRYTVNEHTGRPWLDDFVELIRQHTVHFDKKRLLSDLNGIIKRYFPSYAGTHDYAGIHNYIEKAVNENSSRFCDDFDYLFERLYVLYVCKRRYAINLEYIIDALKALHVVRFLKISLDQVHDPARTPTVEGRTDCVVNQLRESVVEMDGISENLSEDDGFSIPVVTIEKAADLARFFGASPYLHQLFACLLGYYKPFNDIRPIGIGDLLVVKQFLCEYETGEIAHVENVLKGENKERSHRRLDRTEDIFSIQTEQSQETEKELQTTDRYELKVETESTIQNDLNAQIAGSVSGKYGVVEYSASAGVSYSLSTSDSRRSSNNFAKEIVDRSLSRVQKRTREERTTRKIYEVEEINKHVLDNIQGKEHITGIYRWLDKRYKAQVYNYGKRLMFEFVIPEPAAFIAAAFERNKKQGNRPDMPPKPAFPALVISQVSDATVNTYAELYNIDDLEPEPSPTITVRSQPIQMTNAGDSTREFTLDIPAGYEVGSANVAGGRQRNVNVDYGLFVAIGGEEQNLGDKKVYSQFDVNYNAIGALREKLAIAVLSYGMYSYAFNVVVAVNITSEKKREWQLKTYKRIMDAYEKLVTEYNAALSEYQNRLESYEASKGIIIQGRNPAINQDIIKTELKKHCITMIAKQFDAVKEDDITFDSMKSRKEQVEEESTVTTEVKQVTQTTPEPGKTVTVTETTVSETTTLTPVNIDIPAIDIPDARAEGSIIQFLEQAFEWPQISYLLYPYFWGRMPERWFDAQKFYDEEDPLYAKFLQAGSARVLVAVHPAYEIAVMHYLCTKKPWNGGPAPGIHDPLYIPIYEELRNQQDDLNGAKTYGDPWDVVVPTSLVYLQADSALPSYNCDSPGQKP
jgi:hypothetical protein